MCNLKATTFACGHTHLRLISSPCSSSFSTPTNTPNRSPRSPPLYCRAGLQVKSTEQATIPCKFDCQREHALRILTKAYREAVAKVESVSERAKAVEKAMERGAPTPHFKKHGERGWDAEVLAELCKQAFDDTRELLREYAQTKKGLLKEIKGLHLAAKTAVKDYAITTNGALSEMVFFDEKPLVAFGHESCAQLHDLICGIERRASEACLEKQGWKLPEEDVEQCVTLRERARWKSAGLSGTRMDGAYSGNTSKPRINTLPAW